MHPLLMLLFPTLQQLTHYETLISASTIRRHSPTSLPLISVVQWRKLRVGLSKDGQVVIISAHKPSPSLMEIT